MTNIKGFEQKGAAWAKTHHVATAAILALIVGIIVGHFVL